MQKTDTIRLRHMLEAARTAILIAGLRRREDLGTDIMFALALMKSIEIIGEAAGKVSEPCRQAHTDIPWARIIGMRNRLIHAYHDINLELLWNTITDDLPPLIALLEAALAAA